MKSIYYIIMVLAGIIFLNGCDTDENGPMPDSFEESAVAYMVLNPGSSGLVNVSNMDAFNISGTIDVLFDPQYDKLTFLVAYNGDFENAAILADDITSTPYEFDLDIDDVVNVISELPVRDSIKITDNFVFFVNVTKDGIEYPVYTMVGNRAVKTVTSGLATAIRNVENPRGITDLRIDVPCGFAVEDVTGNYIASSPADHWAVNGPVTITSDPEDDFVIYVTGLAELDGLDEDQGPLKIVIDPNSYNVSAERTVLASSAFGYTNIAYAGSGRLNTCDGSYQMNFAISVDQGNFGTFPFTFTRAD